MPFETDRGRKPSKSSSQRPRPRPRPRTRRKEYFSRRRKNDRSLSKILSRRRKKRRRTKAGSLSGSSSPLPRTPPTSRTRSKEHPSNMEAVPDPSGAVLVIPSAADKGTQVCGHGGQYAGKRLERTGSHRTPERKLLERPEAKPGTNSPSGTCILIATFRKVGLTDPEIYTPAPAADFREQGNGFFFTSSLLWITSICLKEWGLIPGTFMLEMARLQTNRPTRNKRGL